jgi:hypothetical protein
VGAIAAPGRYTAKLVVDGETYAQSFEIVRDPHSTGSEQDLRAIVEMQKRISDDISTVSGIVNRIEWMRKELEDIEKSMSAKSDVARVKEMDQKLQNVEYKFITRSQALSDDKYFVEAYNVYFNLIWLNGEIGTGAGDVAGGADYGPTDTSKMLLNDIEANMKSAEAEYRSVMERDVPPFNKWLTDRGTAPLAAGGAQ